MKSLKEKGGIGGRRKESILATLAQELEEREELLSYVLDATGDGIWDWYVDSDSVVHNSSWCTIVGLDDTHLEHPLAFYTTLIHPDDLTMVGDALKGCLEGVRDYEAEYRLRHAEGHYVWVMDRGKVVEKAADGSAIRVVGAIRDISERRRLEDEVRKQNQLLDTILSNVDAHVYMKSHELRYLYVNQKVADLYGRPVTDILGRTDGELHPPAIAERLNDLDRKVFATGCRQTSEETVATPNGDMRHFWSVKVPLRNPDQPDTLIGLSSDITELQTLRFELERQATTDSLTGLRNRRYFFEEADKEFGRARRYGAPLSVMILDIDHFKRLNDTFGHPVGDAVLCAVAAHIEQAVRDCDLVARIGGEEFAVLMPNTDLDMGRQVAERTCASLAARRLDGDWKGTIAPTASIGISTLAPDDTDFPALLKRADQALYQAKDGGRNRVCRG